MYQIKSAVLNCSLIGKVIIIGDSGSGKTSIFNKLIGKEFCEHTPSTIGIDFHSIEIEIDHDRLSTKLSSKLEKVIEDHEVISKRITPKERKELIEAIQKQILKPLKNQGEKQGIGIKLQLWDAAGQEKFRSIVQAYYKNASIILLVFDLYNRNSFDHIEVWISQILNTGKWDNGLPLFYLIGNKNDLGRTPSSLGYPSYPSTQQRLVPPVMPIKQEEIDELCDRYGIISYHSISAKCDNDSIKAFITKVGHELYFHAEFIRELTKLHNISDIQQTSRSMYPKEQRLTINDTNLEARAVCCLLL